MAIPQNLLHDLTKGALMADCLYLATERADHENPPPIIRQSTHRVYL
jgi:hypothetical protein